MTSQYRSNRLPGIIVLILIISLLGGCAKAPAKVEQPTAVAAAAATAEPTKTTAPTATDTPAPTATNTPEPTATATVDLKATADAQKTATVEAQSKEVEAELEKLNIPTNNGHVAWKGSKSINMEVTGYNEDQYSKLDEVGKVGDFVLRSKVTWDSTGGLAGCGVAFRAQDDLKDGEHYSFLMMRLQFHPMWDIEYYKYGRWQTTVTVTGKPMNTNNLLDDRNSSNVIVVDARGEEFNVYLNGDKQRPATSNKIKDGILAFMVFQDSGKTTCKFSDSWVWVFDK